MMYLVTNQTTMFDEDLFKIITPEKALENLNKKVIWGLDTETYGFDPYTKDLLSVQIGDLEEQYCIDISTVDIKIFKEFLENPKRLFILHNAKFDLRFFYHHRIVINRVFDTFLAEKLLWLGFPPGMRRMGLNNLCENYLGVELDKSVRANIPNEGLTSRVIKYGCEDVKYLPSLRVILLNRIEEKGLQIAIGIENQFVKVLAYIEYSGFKLDVNKWKEKMRKDSERLENAKNVLDQWVLDYGDEKFIYRDLQGDLFNGFSEVKCNINWNSPKQVIPLFKQLGFNLLVKDKDTGKMKESIEAPVLKAQKYSNRIVEPYLEYAEAFKTVSTYGQSFIDAINPVSGKIHTQFNQIVDTTRMSSGGKDLDTGQDNINFQNIPADKETRSCFIADEGNLLICADYSAQEDFVFAELSQEPQLIQFYNDKTRKRDGHAFVAKLVFREELDDIAEEDVKKERPDLRQKSKAGKFALHYGGNGMTVARNLGLTDKEGTEFEQNYFKAFPGISKYFREVKRRSWNQGYILISAKTRHKSYIYDWEELKQFEKKLDNSFWNEYRKHKTIYDDSEWYGIIPKAKRNITKQILNDFGEGLSMESISSKNYIYYHRNAWGKVIKTYNHSPSISAVYIECVKYYFQRKGIIERSSLNFPVQGTSAQISKIAGIKYFESLINRDLLFTVWMPNMVHDELEVEAPEEIAHIEAIELQKAMEDSAAMFCKSVSLKAVPEIGKHWIH